MPAWVKNITSLGQAIIVLGAIGAVVWLATERIIDGTAAIVTILSILGIGGAVTTIANKVVEKAANEQNVTYGRRHDDKL
jgi:uncharacterized membrane protein